MKARFTSMPVLQVVLWALIADPARVTRPPKARAVLRNKFLQAHRSRRLVWNCVPPWISTVWPATTIV